MTLLPTLSVPFNTRVPTAGIGKKNFSSGRSNLYLVTLIVNVGVFAVGNLYSWTSPSIPQLQAKGSRIHINTDEASWIGSLIGLGSAFGPFLGGWLVDRVGRRPTAIIAVATGIVSWVVLYQSQKAWEIYLSRIVAGVGGGIVFTTVPLYIGEIAESKVRSALSSLFYFFFTAGLVLEYVVGPYVSFEDLILISSIAPIVFFITSSCIPESPYFHLQQKQEFRAYNNLVWLRKGMQDIQVVDEFNKIKESVEEATKSKGGSFLYLFRTRGNRKGLLLSCGCATFQQLSGINIILFYNQTIFGMTGQSFMEPSQCTVLVGAILLASAVITVPLTHIFGIKFMLLVSATGLTVFMGLLGLYFFLLDEGYNTSSCSWLPVVSIVGFVTFYSFGFGPLPWAVMAEVFPPNIKGQASAFTAACCWMSSFILTKIYPALSILLGNHIVFWGFAVLSFFAFTFVLIFLPDTRGLTMQEIQDVLSGTSSIDGIKTASSSPAHNNISCLNLAVFTINSGVVPLPEVNIDSENPRMEINSPVQWQIVQKL